MKSELTKMTMNEFDIIKTFFTSQCTQRSDVILGIGDDGAILKSPLRQDIIITTDTLVENIHFSDTTSAFDIGYKALAVNLSDLAAMGATPAWITLALTLPTADESWLKNFSSGVLTLATRYNVQLVGGDTTRGPLSITIQAIGFTPDQQALRRDTAKPGDLIYVTHTIGDAAAALYLLKNNKIVPEALLTRLNRPEPRIAIGEELRTIATAAIDISDGLAADLNHILEQSRVGAKIYVDQIPLSETLRTTVTKDEAIAFALTGGDDYELCFTAPKEKNITLYTCIGEITETFGLDLRYTNGEKYNQSIIGYQHFYE
jgi:thiamine-monophosphate kinase